MPGFDTDLPDAISENQDKYKDISTFKLQFQFILGEHSYTLNDTTVQHRLRMRKINT